MSVENHFIKDYEKIRKVVKQWFVYGCYTKEECIKILDISARTYDLEVERLRAYMDEDCLFVKKDKHKKEMGFSYDKFIYNENYFFPSYKMCAYKQRYMRLYLSILQILYDGKRNQKQEYTLEEILNEIDEKDNCIYDNMGQITGDVEGSLDNREISRKMIDLVENGIVKETAKNPKTYSLADNILDCFDIEELVSIYYAAELYAARNSCGAVAMFLKEQIAYYLKYHHKSKEKLEHICIYQYHFLQNILNANILYDIKVAIEQNKQISIVKYCSSKKNKGNSKITFVPYRIMTEYWYGRQYVAGINLESNAVEFVRIVRIQKVDILKADYLEEEKYLEIIENTWCVATGSSKKKKRKLIEIDFYLKEENEKEMKDMLESEKHWGEIEEIDRFHLVFRTEVYDPVELRPWIRKFGAAAKVRKSETHHLMEDLQNDWKEALSKYECISEE